MSRFLTISVVVLLAAALLVPQPAAAKDPVKIGVLVPLTGIVAQGGLEMKMGIEMAAAEKGTLLGRPIELIVEDTQVKPPIAVTKAEKLVYKDDCKALIGVFSSGVGLALAKNIDKLNVPFVSTHVMTTAFYGLHPLVFRSGQLANDQKTWLRSHGFEWLTRVISAIAWPVATLLSKASAGIHGRDYVLALLLTFLIAGLLYALAAQLLEDKDLLWTE